MASTALTTGLDPSRYATTTGGDVAEKQFFTFESQISDKERFKEADPLNLRCMSCESSFTFEGLVDNSVSHPFPEYPLTSSLVQSNRLVWSVPRARASYQSRQ